jgi:hypothetical protein
VGLSIPRPVFDGPLPWGEGSLVADRNRAILRFPTLGTVGIEDGARIRIDPAADASADAVAAHLHASVAALLLAQRGRFALHASTIEIRGVGVAVAGPRGAGKSTTSLRLHQRGHRLIADDVSPVRPGRSPWIEPFNRPVHIHSETAAALGLDVSAAMPAVAGLPKLLLPAPSTRPVRLGAIAALEVAAASPTVRTRRIRGSRAAWCVAEQVYRIELLHPIWQADILAWAGEVAAGTPVVNVTRPRRGWTVDAIADAIETIARDGAEPGAELP